MLTHALHAVGAKDSYFTVTITPDTYMDLDLASRGIPADAEILSVNYTPCSGGLFPVEVHGNTPRLHKPGTAIRIFSLPMEGRQREPTEVHICVTWIPATSADDSWNHLVSAFRFFVEKRYSEAIVPANVAVESNLSILMQQALQAVAGKEKVSSFLEQGATYSHQLNVLLPLLAKLTGEPALSKNIRGLLNRLRKFRNDMAHRGTPDEPLSQDNTAPLLCAALFGFQYVRLIRDPLVAKLSS